MVNAQAWLDKEYLKDKTKNNIEFLPIDSRNLKGELRIEGFSNLERIECFSNELTELSINNCANLTEINCNNNDLVKLKIKDCPNVNKLNISCNSFKSLEFLNDLDTEKLTFLSVHTNNFSDSDLTPFSKFINLEELYLDNYEKKSKYNRFYGSLKPLENLKELRLLNISGTDIDRGLEYLPKSVKKVGCDDKDSKTELKNWPQGYLKIKKELENVVKIDDAREELRGFEGVSEKLQEFEEGDTKWTKEWYRLAPWREKQDLLKGKLKPAREWLDKEYPKWIRREKKELWIHAQNLWSKLDLTDFVNLEKLYCYNNKIRSLELNNLKELTEIYAWNNRLTELNIDNCPNIKILNVSNNRLTKLDFLNNKSKLEFLDISNNDLHKERVEEVKETKEEKISFNLNKFSDFEDLKELYLGSWNNIGGEIYNRFEGSLKDLKKLDKLEYLGIDNTDVENDLGHLPESLEEIHCGTERKSAKCKKIREKLVEYSIPGGRYSYDFQAWLRNSEKDIKKTLERFFDHQTKLIKELKKLEEIAEKIRKQKQTENSSKWLGYIGGGASAIGSVISGSLSGTGNVPQGSPLAIVNPIISGAGGVISIISTSWNSKLISEEKASQEELNNNLIKLGIDIWNRFLRDRKELEEKIDKVKGIIKETLEDFLKISEGLPKSLSPEEKQRMKKKLQEEFILNLWKNHWVKNNYELRESLERFLERIPEIIENEGKKIKNSLNNALEELKKVNEDNERIKKIREEINDYLKDEEEINDGLQILEIKSEKITEEMHWNITKKTKNYLNSWISLESAHKENKELKREIQKLKELKETQITTDSKQKEIEVKNLEVGKAKENEENLEIRRRVSYHIVDINERTYQAQVQVPTEQN